VLPAGQVLPPGESEGEFFARQQDVFDETAQQAAAVGLRAAGFDVGPEDLGGEGALVVETFPDSAATGTLLPGDVIVEAAGEPVGTFDHLRQVLARTGAATLDLTVRRAGRPVGIRITPRPVPGVSEEPVLGIQVTTLHATVDLPVPVAVDSGQIGGPSAGLMIALTVFDKVDPVDLADGRQIAGTGTIAFDGAVGPISGIEQKVLAAHRQDVDVFLAPDAQLEEAGSLLPADSDMVLVGVGTFDEALDALGGEIAAR
jgi:PDZ domain-containing protein